MFDFMLRGTLTRCLLAMSALCRASDEIAQFCSFMYHSSRRIFLFYINRLIVAQKATCLRTGLVVVKIYVLINIYV